MFLWIQSGSNYKFLVALYMSWLAVLPLVHGSLRIHSTETLFCRIFIVPSRWTLRNDYDGSRLTLSLIVSNMDHGKLAYFSCSQWGWQLISGASLYSAAIGPFSQMLTWDEPSTVSCIPLTAGDTYPALWVIPRSSLSWLEGSRNIPHAWWWWWWSTIAQFSPRKSLSQFPLLFTCFAS